MSAPVSVRTLLTSSQKYSIPLYQRNFAWTYDEIGQLIIDVLDSINSGRREYYIGTLVVSDQAAVKSIIDGQQRITALLLIGLAIQNNYRNDLGEVYLHDINLQFAARKRSNRSLAAIANGQDPEETEEITQGYNTALTAIQTYVLRDPEYQSISMEQFYRYFFEHVKLFVSTMPKDLDLNLYFERFNSRGEQLEYHEVVKAELMQRLHVEGVDHTQVKQFAKIWDACSEFDTPVISFFRKKARSTDTDNEREMLFENTQTEFSVGKQYGFEFSDIYSKFRVAANHRRSLIDVIQKDADGVDAPKEVAERTDETTRYRPIINFNTFLYYVLYLTDNHPINEIKLDDKKLLETFAPNRRDKDWILQFGANLLQLKFIFDNLIIRNSLETTSRRTEGEWFLQKAYRVDRNEKRYGRLYVQTRFDKNAFEEHNQEILMIQAMFAVTFTAYKDTRWLYTTLKYLFENAHQLNEPEFGTAFLNFLEGLSRDYANERFAEHSVVKPSALRYDHNVPFYAFNLMDYVLWKQRSELKPMFPTVAYDQFSFRYRRSIEHWYPQNPETTNLDDGRRKMTERLLHSFGNLAIIVASQNSKFSNLVPRAKFDQWQHPNIFPGQSLKLQMMAADTVQWGEWDQSRAEEIGTLESDLIARLNTYLQKKTKMEIPLEF